MTNCLFDIDYEEKIHNLTERDMHWEDEFCPCRMCDHLHKNNSEKKKKERLDLRRKYKNIIRRERTLDFINKKLLYADEINENNTSLKKEHRLGHREYGLNEYNKTETDYERIILKKY